MVLLALPFPPLPCVVGRVEGMELTGEEQVKNHWVVLVAQCGLGVLSHDNLCKQVVTTHTLYAKCLEEARLRGDTESHARRRGRQVDVFQRFLHAMATRGFEAEGEALYAVYCEFSRAHLGTYFDNPPEASLLAGLPLVSGGDRACFRSCSSRCRT